ncbi:MAG: gamma-glutamyltranspeptidase/glutathione hydrolase [Woeseiaceae bacterium]|jgi:gamma-glutamyltranspeptidase/glutathione hydrolase
MNNRVGVATTSQLAADAAAQIAECGGNAVDCAIAAAMCSINTEPGVCALAGSAYVTIWPPDGEPVTIDGNVSVPGSGLVRGFTPRADNVHMEYGGGIETVVGPASVAVPGTLAALDLASQEFGQIPWRELLGPTIDAARNGFPLSAACHYYLEYSADVVFGRSADGHSALHDGNGSLLPAGSNIIVPHLADSLAAIADEGAQIFYSGEIGQRIAAHVQDNGGLLTRSDLENYTPLARESLLVQSGDWCVATNPPPAIGGTVLSAMLLAFQDQDISRWDEASLQRLMQVQDAALSYRKTELDPAPGTTAPATEMLELARSGRLLSRWSSGSLSGSTVHTSVVDESGLACAITASSGYGSGEMPATTGLWLNNCLGELELNLHGLDAGPAGRRLPSNMAPGAARSKGRVLAMGSPGADRITTALHQFLVNYIQLGFSLEDAIAHPRMHLAIDDDGSTLAIEADLDIGEIGIPITRYPQIGMYFGGVVAAVYDTDDGFAVAADPRREGGTYIGPN